MNYEEKVDKIRSYFNEHKAERYPFVNAALAEKDEYIKSLYFRMLCMLVRYTDEADEMQSLYIRRLIAGANAENTFHDYMRMAIEIETKDIEDFISIFSEDKLKYYFCIDGTILLSVASNDKNFELLAELVELLGITKAETYHLAAVARAVCLQDSAAYDDAKIHGTDNTNRLDMSHYLQSFYSGDLVNTPSLLHIFSSDKSAVDLSKYQFSGVKKVIIENVGNNIDAELWFQNCSEVIFRNCKLTGGEHAIIFEGEETVKIENCDISDFSARFAGFDKVGKIIVQHNKFTNCGCKSVLDECGGVMIGRDFETAIFDANELLNCYVGSEIWATGVLFHGNGDSSEGKITVTNNTFAGCECRKNSGGRYPGSYISGRFGEKSESGNSISGTVTKIFVE